MRGCSGASTYWTAGYCTKMNLPASAEEGRKAVPQGEHSHTDEDGDTSEPWRLQNLHHKLTISQAIKQGDKVGQGGHYPVCDLRIATPLGSEHQAPPRHSALISGSVMDHGRGWNNSQSIVMRGHLPLNMP